MPRSAPRLRPSPDHSPRLCTGITLAIIAYQAGVAMPLEAAVVARSRKNAVSATAGAERPNHHTARPIRR